MHISKNYDGLVYFVAKQQKRAVYMLLDEWKSKMKEKNGIPEKIMVKLANITIFQ